MAQSFMAEATTLGHFRGQGLSTFDGAQECLEDVLRKPLSHERHIEYIDTVEAVDPFDGLAVGVLGVAPRIWRRQWHRFGSRRSSSSTCVSLSWIGPQRDADGSCPVPPPSPPGATLGAHSCQESRPGMASRRCPLDREEVSAGSGAVLPSLPNLYAVFRGCLREAEGKAGLAQGAAPRERNVDSPMKPASLSPPLPFRAVSVLRSWRSRR